MAGEDHPFCSGCGRKWETDHNFCPGCGAPRWSEDEPKEQGPPWDDGLTRGQRARAAVDVRSAEKAWARGDPLYVHRHQATVLFGTDDKVRDATLRGISTMGWRLVSSTRRMTNTEYTFGR